ncbi:TetR/AcrR family transcriptional regulator [Paludisphaera rhizosphaerae]|uniref:TetR/AcrR family transcriptional regulator n=1 Tax=Paludisphaera rhizosphaerae TaxID=2711216 RepID=UPI0013EA3940|nr:TetR/AcrR family transcriptional regulator [Paludisphaera rhizosphaerae]
MPRPSHREKLLEEGLRVVLEHGYNGASVRDIVRAAGVPQGCFTNHFRSKEAFAEEVLNRYFDAAASKVHETLLNDNLPPLERLRAWVDAHIESLARSNFRTGCLVGNFTLEIVESDSIRARLREMIESIEQAVGECLTAAVQAGELPPSTDVRGLASFAYFSWQGAVGQAKIERCVRPLELYKDILFGRVLSGDGR